MPIQIRQLVINLDIPASDGYNKAWLKRRSVYSFARLFIHQVCATIYMRDAHTTSKFECVRSKSRSFAASHGLGKRGFSQPMRVYIAKITVYEKTSWSAPEIDLDGMIFLAKKVNSVWPSECWRRRAITAPDVARIGWRWDPAKQWKLVYNSHAWCLTYWTVVSSLVFVIIQHYTIWYSWKSGKLQTRKRDSDELRPTGSTDLNLTQLVHCSQAPTFSSLAGLEEHRRTKMTSFLQADWQLEYEEEE